jgi:hypothetical protein
MVMRNWDGHCPECGSDSVTTLLVKPAKLRKQCGACKHKWSEAREMPLMPHAGYVPEAANDNAWNGGN